MLKKQKHPSAVFIVANLTYWLSKTTKECFKRGINMYEEV